MKNYIKIKNIDLSLKPIYIIKNPTINQYMNLLKNSKNNIIRGIINKENGDFYITDAYYFIHDAMCYIISDFYCIDEFDFFRYEHDYDKNQIKIEILNEDKITNEFKRIVNYLESNRQKMYIVDSLSFKTIDYTLFYNDYLMAKNKNDFSILFEKYPVIKMFLTKNDFFFKEKITKDKLEEFVSNRFIENLMKFKY